MAAVRRELFVSTVESLGCRIGFTPDLGSGFKGSIVILNPINDTHKVMQKKCALKTGKGLLHPPKAGIKAAMIKWRPARRHEERAERFLEPLDEADHPTVS